MTHAGFTLGVVSGMIRPPGSKSLTIRALVAGALAPGKSHLYSPLVSDDTQAMIGVLRDFGVVIDTESDPWVIHGAGGVLHPPGNALDARLSGLTARIAIAMASRVDGRVTIDGQGRLKERPMIHLLDALTSQGVGVTSTDGHLPVTISGVGGLWGGELEIDSSVSSQFITALLLVAPLNRHPTTIRVVGVRLSEGYAGLTSDVMRAFGARIDETVTGYEVAVGGYQPADLQIEADVSAAVYPMVGAAITGGRIELQGVKPGSQQPDLVVARHLNTMGCRIGEGSHGMIVEGPSSLTPIEVDMKDAPDGAMALAVACLFATGPSRISGLSTLRHKESDRLQAMQEGLVKLGAEVVVEDDAMLIRPGTPRSGVIDPHADHRVAMALALAGLRIEGVTVSTPDVVDKTWPDYWSEMSAVVIGHDKSSDIPPR